MRVLKFLMIWTIETSSSASSKLVYPKIKIFLSDRFDFKTKANDPKSHYISGLDISISISPNCS